MGKRLEEVWIKSTQVKAFWAYEFEKKKIKRLFLIYSFAKPRSDLWLQTHPWYYYTNKLVCKLHNDVFIEVTVIKQTTFKEHHFPLFILMLNSQSPPPLPMCPQPTPRGQGLNKYCMFTGWKCIYSNFSCYGQIVFWYIHLLGHLKSECLTHVRKKDLQF